MEGNNMDVIEELIEEIKKDTKVQKTRFNSNFLNNVGEVFERHGFGVTRTFLIEKRGRRDLRYQADALLGIVEKFEKNEKIQQNRSIGRYIIKTLISLK
jgi:hypothetical protein